MRTGFESLIDELPIMLFLFNRIRIQLWNLFIMFITCCKYPVLCSNDSVSDHISLKTVESVSKYPRNNHNQYYNYLVYR